MTEGGWCDESGTYRSARFITVGPLLARMASSEVNACVELVAELASLNDGTRMA